MSTTSVTIRMDKDLKKSAEQIFAELGLTMSTALNVFLRQTVRYNGIPFEMRLETPNAETIAAMEEADRISRDPNVKKYSDVKEFLSELRAECTK